MRSRLTRKVPQSSGEGQARAALPAGRVTAIAPSPIWARFHGRSVKTKLRVRTGHDKGATPTVTAQSCVAPAPAGFTCFPERRPLPSPGALRQEQPSFAPFQPSFSSSPALFVASRTDNSASIHDSFRWQYLKVTRRCRLYPAKQAVRVKAAWNQGQVRVWLGVLGDWRDITRHVVQDRVSTGLRMALR